MQRCIAFTSVKTTRFIPQTDGSTEMILLPGLWQIQPVALRILKSTDMSLVTADTLNFHPHVLNVCTELFSSQIVQIFQSHLEIHQIYMLFFFYNPCVNVCARAITVLMCLQKWGPCSWMYIQYQTTAGSLWGSNTTALLNKFRTLYHYHLLSSATVIAVTYLQSNALKGKWVSDTD